MEVSGWRVQGGGFRVEGTKGGEGHLAVLTRREGLCSLLSDGKGFGYVLRVNGFGFAGTGVVTWRSWPGGRALALPAV